MLRLALILALLALPALTGRVVDNAGLLPPTAEARLAARLQGYEARTRHQFVVVTVTSLGGEAIDDFGYRLANGWGVGRRVHNDGIVLIVAPAERRTRIEVGLGLAPRLTDARCARIIDTVLLPAFARGDFAGGIERGADAVMAAVPD